MKQIDRVREDPDVVGVVLRIDSPGGTITGSDYIYHHLRELMETRKLPLVVSMGSVCASGGYYVAMAVGSEPDSIYAEPATWTGSIGVIIPHFDISGGLSKLGISDDSIASGPLKEMGTPTRPMRPRNTKSCKPLWTNSFKDSSRSSSAAGRSLRITRQVSDAVTTGQIFTAKQASAHGLVDHIGFIDAAIARVTKLAGESADTVRCVKYEKSANLMGELLGADAHISPVQASVDVAALIEFPLPGPTTCGRGCRARFPARIDLLIRAHLHLQLPPCALHVLGGEHIALLPGRVRSEWSNCAASTSIHR